mgnify:CR=1 FL=1
MVKARKTMRHLKKKGKKGASKVGKSARRRTTKHQRRTRRRMKLRGGMNPAANNAQPADTKINENIAALKDKVENMEKRVNEIGSAPITCTVGNVEGN